MDSPIQQINNQFVRMDCVENGLRYIAYIRVGSVTGITDKTNQRTIITSDKEYITNDTFSSIKTKFNMRIN